MHPRLRRQRAGGYSGFTSGTLRVLENRFKAGTAAARHLLERGYQCFAHLGFVGDPHSYIERSMFRRWLEWRGRRWETRRIPKDYRRTKAFWRAMESQLAGWLDRLGRPVGIYCTRDELARHLAVVALRKGLRIPEDIGIMGAGNDPALCEFPEPALTSMEFLFPEVGYRAAELLDRMMDGEPPPRRNVLIPPTVVLRRSTDRERVADPRVADAVYWIATHSWHPIRPSHVAAAFGLSLRTLEQRFKRARGRTILREITRARVEHAGILLRDPWALAAVAHHSGFPSKHAMRRAFQRHEGCTPDEYRRKRIHRGDAENTEDSQRGRMKVTVTWHDEET